MKLLLPLLLAPVLSLAATTGSVTLLDGTPVSGAVIKSLTDSVVTSATGSFALGRTSGISPRFAKTVPVTSHLTVENGRPRLSFAGMDIAGRTRSATTVRQNLSSTGASFAARSTGTPDTLKVYWKGKRLTVLPVTTDTTVTFRIDTAWKDDAGIPWNPTIAYGSLFDTRDGQTYRTVTIGSQTWMAENLNFKWGNSTDSFCLESATAKYCRYSVNQLYSWSEAMAIDTAYDRIQWQGSSTKGICPISWHIPSNMEWTDLFPTDTILVEINSTGDTISFPLELTKSPNLYDMGYRIHFTTTEGSQNETQYNQAVSFFWSSEQFSNQKLAPNTSLVGGQSFAIAPTSTPYFSSGYMVSRSSATLKYYKASLRCLKD